MGSQWSSPPRWKFLSPNHPMPRRNYVVIVNRFRDLRRLPKEMAQRWPGAKPRLDWRMSKIILSDQECSRQGVLLLGPWGGPSGDPVSAPVSPSFPTHPRANRSAVPAQCTGAFRNRQDVRGSEGLRRGHLDEKHPTDSGAKIVCSGQALGAEIFRRLVLVSPIQRCFATTSSCLLPPPLFVPCFDLSIIHLWSCHHTRRWLMQSSSPAAPRPRLPDDSDWPPNLQFRFGILSDLFP